MIKGQSWKEYEAAAERGPLPVAFKAIFALFLVGGVIAVVGWGLGWFSGAAVVAKEEFGARAMLQKYEWFKDAAAQLDKKRADIEVYASRQRAMDATYSETTRASWPREDREQYNLWTSEVAGVKASYNALAAEYNAQMAKFNWRFANAGQLPAGASDPLPREFCAYVGE